MEIFQTLMDWLFTSTTLAIIGLLTGFVAFFLTLAKTPPKRHENLVPLIRLLKDEPESWQFLIDGLVVQGRGSVGVWQNVMVHPCGIIIRIGRHYADVGFKKEILLPGTANYGVLPLPNDQRRWVRTNAKGVLDAAKQRKEDQLRADFFARVKGGRDNGQD